MGKPHRRARTAPPTAAFAKLALVRVGSHDPDELDMSLWCACDEGAEGAIDRVHLSEDLLYDKDCTVKQARQHLQNMLDIVGECKRGDDGGIPLDLLLAPLQPADVLRPPATARRQASSFKPVPASEAKYARLRGYMSICDVIIDLCKHLGRLELALEHLTFLADAVTRPEYRSPLCGRSCVHLLLARFAHVPSEFAWLLIIALAMSGTDDTLAERMLRDTITPTASDSCIYERVALARLLRRQHRVLEADQAFVLRTWIVADACSDRLIREHALHWSTFHDGPMARCGRSARQLRNALDLMRWRGSGVDPIAAGLPRGFFKSNAAVESKPFPTITRPDKIACEHCGYVVDACDIKLCKSCRAFAVCSQHCLEHEWPNHLPFCRLHRADAHAGPTLKAFRKLCDSARPAIAFALPSALDLREHREHLDSKMLLLDFAFDPQDPSSFALDDAAVIDLNACSATPVRSKGDTSLLCPVLCRANGLSYRCAIELPRFCFSLTCACCVFVSINHAWLADLKRDIVDLPRSMPLCVNVLHSPTRPDGCKIGPCQPQ